MTSFSLKIVTPDGLAFDGMAEQVTVRTTSGDMGVMAGHRNWVAPLGMGQATIVTDGQRKYAAAIGGMLSRLTETPAPPIEFDEKLWHAVVDKVTVYNDDRLVYSLKDGTEITVKL